MIARMEIPVGTRLIAITEKKRIPVVVVSGGTCGYCAFRRLQASCKIVECSGSFRTDRTPVIFKEIKGGGE